MVFYKILAIHECLLKAKNWGEMGQKRCARSGLHHIWLILMKSVQNEKVLFPQMIMVCQKNFHLSKEKNIFWLFLWFWKNHKNGQKLIFSFERWKFFWHTLIIWENCTFSFSTLFDLLKNGWKWKQKHFCARVFFCHFWLKFP